MVWPRARDVPAPPAQVPRHPSPRRSPPGKKRDDRQDRHQPSCLRIPVALLARLDRYIDYLEAHRGMKAHRGMIARQA